jgi:serine protease
MNRTLPLLALLSTACASGTGTSDVDEFAWLDSSDIQFDAPVPDDAEFHPTRVIVGFWDHDRPTGLDVSGLRLSRGRLLQSLPAATYEIDSGDDVRTVVEELRASGQFRWVEPDYVRTASVNDPYFSYQWHMDAVGASSAWASSTGAGTVVAVIDTGVSSGPNDGIGTLVTGYDFVNNDTDASDDNGHGTHVAGTIAQTTNNGAGTVGLAYDAAIMPIKVLDRRGSGYTSDTVDGINFAVSQGADVINLSLGSSYYSASEAAAVYNAYTAGVFVACASGNAGSSSVDYPGAYTGSVAVGATGYGDYRTSYSNRGTALDLVAPGGDTSVDYNGDGYADGVLQETFTRRTWSFQYFQGTSMASPHVAAAAALLMANGATNVEAQDALEATAVDLGASGWDSSYGNGLIQADAALAYYGGGPTPVDSDGDGYDTTSDCDDSDASVNPGAAEVCGDGIDQDCDGVDDACPAVDADGDGYDDTVDCDDTDASINPGAAEVCDDGIDQDCDGVDEACPAPDLDGDGYDETVDCDDTDASINPGAAEVCGDGIDQDCDGVDDTCGTGPVISGVSDSTSKSTRTVVWSTDVSTTGEVCNDHGDCATTGWGTSHSAGIHKRGSSYTIVATDSNGDTDSVTVSY